MPNAITMRKVEVAEVMTLVDKIRDEEIALAISRGKGGGVKVLQYRPANDDYAVLFNESTCHFFSAEDAVRHYNNI